MFDRDDPTLRGPRQVPKDVPQDTFERDLALREMNYFNGPPQYANRYLRQLDSLQETAGVPVDSATRQA